MGRAGLATPILLVDFRAAWLPAAESPVFFPVAQAPRSFPTAGGRSALRGGNADELSGSGSRKVSNRGEPILLADGYKLPRYFEIRSGRRYCPRASGDRQRAILDGAESRHGQLVGITGCSGVTIAHLTIQKCAFQRIQVSVPIADVTA